MTWGGGRCFFLHMTLSSNCEEALYGTRRHLFLMRHSVDAQTFSQGAAQKHCARFVF